MFIDITTFKKLVWHGSRLQSHRVTFLSRLESANMSWKTCVVKQIQFCSTAMPLREYDIIDNNFCRLCASIDMCLNDPFIHGMYFQLIAGEFPAQRTVTPSFDVFFHLRLNKRLSKQSRGWWFETPSPDVTIMDRGYGMCYSACRASLAG